MPSRNENMGKCSTCPIRIGENMTTVNRRRLLGSIAATTVCGGMAPSIEAASTTELLDIDRRAAECWFIARQDRARLGKHAVDFWSKPFCDLDHTAYVPSEIVRGVLWFNYADYPHCLREPEVLDYVDSVLKQKRSDWLNNP